MESRHNLSGLILDFLGGSRGQEPIRMLGHAIPEAMKRARLYRNIVKAAKRIVTAP